MNEHKLDYINIGWMLLACLLAFVLPFELFLFSYAVLGPLHYLTEISWLHQRNYFTTGKNDFYVLTLFCLLISLGVAFHDIFVVRKWLAGWIEPDTIRSALKLYSTWFPVLLFAAFAGSLGLVVFKKLVHKLLFFAAGIFVGYLLIGTSFQSLLIATFVPTLIHVYVFTALFMVYGALKSRSLPGFVSVLVMLGCALSFYWIQYVPEGYSPSQYIKDSLIKSTFVSVNMATIGLFKSGGITMFDIFESRKGLMVQRFIAFAYTYHYLNWFSKTEIIKWHLVPKRWLVISIILWLSSIALYIYDYRTGLITLFFLSLLHVFLEFPLNYISIKGILQEVLSFGKARKK